MERIKKSFSFGCMQIPMNSTGAIWKKRGVW